MTTKTRNRTYRSFDPLLADLKTQMSGSSVDPRKVIQIIERDTESEISRAQLEELLSLLQAHKNKDSFEFALVATAEVGEGRSLVTRKLSSEIVAKARRELQYPLQVGMPKGSDLQPVLDWISLIQRDSDGKSLSYEKLRKAVICLLPEIHKPIFVTAITRIQTLSIKLSKKRNENRASDLNKFRFARAAIQPMMSVRPKVGGLKTFVDIAEGFKIELDQLVNRMNDLSADLESSKLDIAHLREQIADLQRSKDKNEQELGKAKDEVRACEDQLLTERNRYSALEKYWTENSKKQRNEAVYRIKQNLEHDINEIRLCLERDIPNTSMAVERLRRIDEFLAGLVES